MVGPGWGMNRGAGRRITTDVGSITIIRGHGVRAVSFIASAVGGGPPWLRLYSTYRSETMSAGIRCRITSVIRILVIIVMTTGGQATIDRGTADPAGETIDIITI